ncbi:hypothetical protein IscW_ISCW012759 [Ixodes scapularis]|uniref:Uncharacterized protein n=1 Tax=Ixodes scapularis TaxID=6945 RepID=B7QB53_IXOSC|nr:hypothetical protein IscW_ISCW012759 [Ixodes scapularis]|eukprot:XP_002412779.1 hypothetical protein IscW_ISCW012759 [Ixodes scapularis]
MRSARTDGDRNGSDEQEREGAAAAGRPVQSTALPLPIPDIGDRGRLGCSAVASRPVLSPSAGLRLCLPLSFRTVEL